MADPSPTKYENLRKVMLTTSHLHDSGMIVVKAHCGQFHLLVIIGRMDVNIGDDIRRIPILNRELTYDELCLMMFRLFRNTLSVSNAEQIVLHYKDDDGDLVMLTDDLDIAHAISLSPVLRIFIHGKTVATSTLRNRDRQFLQNELKHLRERIESMLRHLDDRPPSASPSEEESKKSENILSPEKRTSSGEKPSLRPLTTSDMTELLAEEHSRKKSLSASPPIEKMTKELLVTSPIAPPSSTEQQVNPYPQPPVPPQPVQDLQLPPKSPSPEVSNLPLTPTASMPPMYFHHGVPVHHYSVPTQQYPLSPQAKPFPPHAMPYHHPLPSTSSSLPSNLAPHGLPLPSQLSYKKQNQ